MRRFLQSGLIAAAALALIAPAAPALASSGEGGALAPVGSAAAVPSSATTLGAVPADQAISFDVVLKPRNQAALDQFVHDVSTPGSPTYHQFLKTGEFDTRFGATPQAIKAVTDQMKRLGLDVNSVDGSILHVSSSTTKVASALHTSFKQYRLKSGRVARANVAAPELSTTVSPYVQGIVGLDTLVQAHHPTPTVKANVASAGVAHPNTVAPSACFLESTSGYYSAGQVASYYGLDSYWNAGNFGAGTTIAMFELEDYDPADIAAYQDCYGTNASVTNTLVDGGATSGPGIEATLDVEIAIGLAPDAAIAVYEAPNTEAGILHEYAKIAADNTASIVSTSWGACEALIDIGFASSERQIFQQMAAQGQTVFAASGDQGSEDCDYNPTPNPPPNDSSALAVDDPASQPEVTGVGGTDLTTESGPETVWNRHKVLDPDSGLYRLSAAGGGQSTYWTMPSWQTDLGVIAGSSGSVCGASAGSYCREVPDVSASADPNDGYVIAYDVIDYPDTLAVVGGTSAAAPMWASLLALIESSGGSRLGLINPTLYALRAANSSAFNDVTVGNNDAIGTNGGLYPALAGYDMATGLGTPIAASVGAGLIPPPADGSGTMTVSPTSVLASSSNTLRFTYTPPTGQVMYDGEVSVQVPADWTKPSTTPGDPGYTTSSSGTVTISGTGPWTIDVQNADTLASNLTIVYGDTGGGGRAAAPPATTQSMFASAVRSEMGAGSLMNLAAQPNVNVSLANDGAGTTSVSPNSVNIDAPNQTLVFTYTPPAGTGLLQGEVDVTVPSGWSGPSMTATAAGYFTASTGILGLNGRTMQVSDVSLSPGDQLTITYGDKAGGGPGATVSNVPGSVTFTTSQKSTAGGSLTPLAPTASQPVVQVITGTMTVTPSTATRSTTTSLTFTYTAATGTPLTVDEVDLQVPAGWTTPSTTTPTDPGYVTASAGAVGVSGTTIQVTSLNLGAGDTVTIVYGDTSGGGPGSTVTSTTGASRFNTSEHVTPATFTHNLAAMPTVIVTAPPPSGGGGGGGGGGAVGHPDLVRVSGPDRIATSVAAAQAAFPKANGARVAVLARSDSFADALAGTPLAASEGGPLLLTFTSSLPASTASELSRVLPGGSTVYLLGGTSAINPSVQSALASMGYSVTRLAGADRYATAVAVAGALGNPTTVFEADGTNFPDALSAGSAAARQGGVVLLTAGAKQSAATSGYLAAHPSVRYAVGGPAAKADPGATALVGADRYATSVAVAKMFFNAPLSVGLASGMNFPDALSGGAVTANHGGPILLVPNTGAIPAGTTGYLTQTAALSASSAWLFGGPASVSDGVFSQAAAALKATTP